MAERAGKLGSLLTGRVPAHPAAADYLAAMNGGWHMLGNDTEGDCAAVTWANARRLVTATLGGVERYPTLDQVITVYRTQNPQFDPNGSADTNGPGSEADGGMDLQTLFETLHKTPGPDGAQIVAFAQVDPKNAAEVRAAIAIFVYVWSGTLVQQANEQQFADEQPWDYVSGSPVVGGHSILTGGYGKAVSDATALGGDEKFVTWAAETSFTDRFWRREVDEAWAVLWPEHLGTREFEQASTRTR
jgi:hypothetical protein